MARKKLYQENLIKEETFSAHTKLKHHLQSSNFLFTSSSLFECYSEFTHFKLKLKWSHFVDYNDFDDDNNHCTKVPLFMSNDHMP